MQWRHFRKRVSTHPFLEIVWKVVKKVTIHSVKSLLLKTIRLYHIQTTCLKNRYVYPALLGGDAFNLVVLHEGKCAEDFINHSDNKVHREAAVNIAPHYYRSVRIHRLLVAPAEEEGDKVKFERTLVKEFCAGEVSFRAVFTHPLR